MEVLILIQFINFSRSKDLVNFIEVGFDFFLKFKTIHKWNS